MWGFLAAVGFGATDELHQWFVPRRQPSWLDWAADALGAAVGVLLWAGVRRLAPSRESSAERGALPAGHG
ncbi:MAG: VanZ family protein [Candidatus Dadabacteria bacterium]|nr:MAG: VanZ family protein [Candidatus Dadabacteria bacterium]